MNEFLKSAANRALPAIELESYEDGDYSSVEEIEEDLDQAWEQYKQETGLQEFGSLDSVFDIEYSLKGDNLTVNSADYRLRFGEDLRSIRDRLSGEEAQEPYEAILYTTQHFEDRETPEVVGFFTGFLDENFDRLE